MDVYIRVSRTGDRTEEESTEVYEAQCREWADRSGVEVGEVVEDTDVSGKTAVAERGLEQLIQRVEQGESEGIVTPYLDRFGRNMIEGALALKRIVDAGGKLIAVRDGFDSAQPGSNLNFNIRMAFAQDFLDRNDANWDATYDRVAEKGIYLACKPPFGYKRDEDRRLAVVDAERPVVVELFERRAAGEGFASLRHWMRERCAELPPVGGEPHPASRITTTGVKRILKRRAYLGEMRVPRRGHPGDPRIVKATHPPIITEEMWEAAQIKPTFTPRPRGDGPRFEVQLRGLVYCAGCGRRLKVHGYAKPGKPRSANYACTSEGCPERSSMKAELLDDYVADKRLEAAVNGEPHVVAVIEGDSRFEDAMAEVREARRLLDEYRDDTNMQTLLGMADFAKGIESRKEALRLAQKRLAEVKPTTPPSGPKVEVQSAQHVEALMEADANARFIDRVVVGRGRVDGRHLKPHERVEVYWKGAESPAA